MSKVIDFPEKTNPETVFVCRCGCSTWYLHGEKSASCAHCGLQIDDPGVVQHGWGQLPPPAKPQEIPELGEQDPVVIDFNTSGVSFDFLKSRLENYKEFAAVILMRQNGSVHTWGNIVGEKQRKWFERQVNKARKLLFEPETPKGNDNEPELWAKDWDGGAD